MPLEVEADDIVALGETAPSPSPEARKKIDHEGVAHDMPLESLRLEPLDHTTLSSLRISLKSIDFLPHGGYVLRHALA